ncbi:hypothetical protein D3C72_812920 [compost metagenome]
MHRGAVAGIPDHAQARAELALGVAERLEAVAAQAVVDRPVIAYPPLILHVQCRCAGVEGVAVRDQLRRGACLPAIGIDREYPAAVVGGGVFVVAIQAIAQGVVVAQRRGEIGLQGVGAVAALDLRGDATEHQVADDVRVEGHVAVALAGRQLVRGLAQRALQHQHAEAGGLALGFVQLAGIEGGGVQVTELRGLPRVDRNLEAVVGEAGEHAQAGVVVDQIGQVGKGLALVGIVMQRLACAGGVLQPDLVLVVVAGQEPAPAALVAPPGGIRVDLAERAAGDARAAAVTQLGATAGRDIDHCGGAFTELGRQGAIHQADALDGAGIQGLAEAGDRFGQQYAVDAVLQVGVVAAHVHAAVGVLDHARGLQQHLAERGGGAQGLLLDVLGGDLVLAAADVRRQGVAGLVELGTDGDHVEVLDRSRAGISVGGKHGLAGQDQGEGDGGGEQGGLHGKWAGKGGRGRSMRECYSVTTACRSCACPAAATMPFLADQAAPFHAVQAVAAVPGPLRQRLALRP